MRRVVVFEHLTLDGVMQAPGCADGDRRDGFVFATYQSGAKDRWACLSDHLERG